MTMHSGLQLYSLRSEHEKKNANTFPVNDIQKLMKRLASIKFSNIISTYYRERERVAAINFLCLLI